MDLSGNLSHAVIERTIHRTCEVANLRYGRDMIVNLGE